MLYSQSRRAVEVYCNQEKPANPELLQRLQGVTSSLFMQRIIRLGGAVDDDMANVIVAQVRWGAPPHTNNNIRTRERGPKVVSCTYADLFRSFKSSNHSCSSSTWTPWIGRRTS